MWITLTESAVLTRLSGPELTALKTAALGTGQTNPLTEVITQVVREVRGYVSASTRNRLGTGETIPDELSAAALSRIRFELATRLPVASLLTDARREANRDAIALLRECAAGRFTLVAPETEAADQAANASGPAVSTSNPTRQWSRSGQAGL